MSKRGGQKTGSALRAGVFSFAGFGGLQVLRLANNLVLARLLFPSAFGLMALVNVFVEGVQMISDVGIGPSIIRSSRGEEPSFLNTAWTIQAIRGALLFAAVCAFTPLLASFYDEPELNNLLPVAAISIAIRGLDSTKLHLQNRHLAIGRLTLLELGSQAVGVATMIVWAAVAPSVWAMVGGPLVAAGSKTLLTHMVLPGAPNRFDWSRDHARELLSFGRWIFLSSMLTFLVRRGDRLVFGKIVTVDMLGVYNIGAMLAGIAFTALGQVGHRVVFPVYSRVLNRGGSLHTTFAKVRRPLLLLAGVGFSALVAVGPAAVDLLYDARYHGAGWVVQILAVGNWLGVLESTNGAALLAKGHARLVAAGSATKLVTAAALIPIGFVLFDFPGAVAGFAAGDFFKYMFSAWAIRREGLADFRQDAGFSALLVVAGFTPMLVLAHAPSWQTRHVLADVLSAGWVVLVWLPFGWEYLVQLWEKMWQQVAASWKSS